MSENMFGPRHTYNLSSRWLNKNEAEQILRQSDEDHADDAIAVWLPHKSIAITRHKINKLCGYAYHCAHARATHTHEPAEARAVKPSNHKGDESSGERIHENEQQATKLSTYTQHRRTLNTQVIGIFIKNTRMTQHKNALKSANAAAQYQSELEALVTHSPSSLSLSASLVFSLPGQCMCAVRRWLLFISFVLRVKCNAITR